MIKNRIFKTVISLFTVFTVIFLSFTVSPSVYAFNYPKISLNQIMNGKLEDYFGGVTYELNLESDKKVSVVYRSTSETDFCVYDEKMNTIFTSYGIKKINKTLSLKKGDYVFGIYNCTYAKGTYRLQLKSSDESIPENPFTTESFTLSVGEKTKLTLKREINQHSLKGIFFSSLDKNVAEVNKNGKITAIGLGKTKIIAKHGKNTLAECNITVNNLNMSVFRKSRKSLANLIKSDGYFVSSDSSVAKVTNNSVKGVSQGSAVLTKYNGSEKYTVSIRVVAAKRLANTAKKRLKKVAFNPVIYHIYRGYNSKGEACVVLEYELKNTLETKYFVCNYNTDFSLNYKYSSKMPALKSLKEI